MMTVGRAYSRALLLGPQPHKDRLQAQTRAAIALLRSWREEDPEQQRAVWETLKQTLDEDRLSDRERVP
jgi:hypothetical protein